MNSLKVLLARCRSNRAFVLDVRSEAEYRAGALEGAVNVPHLLLPKFIGELPREEDIFVHCRSGVRSSYSCALLEKKGLHPVNIVGGYEALVQK